MTDMGILRVTMAIESHGRRGEVRELPNVMVDTGSEYTWVPRGLLESLGVGVERVEQFVTADGRVIAREMGYAIVHAGAARTSDEVVFADPGDMTLLGAHTIEGMNLRVDLKTKRLVPAGPVPVAAGGQAWHRRGRRTPWTDRKYPEHAPRAQRTIISESSCAVQAAETVEWRAARGTQAPP